jgi:hypothetical protein
VVILLSPLVTGTTASWELLEPKNELVKVGQKAVGKLTGKRGEDFLDHHARMAAAHCLLCYTAFFDVTAKATATFGRNLKLSAGEKVAITEVALSKLRLAGDEDADVDAAAAVFVRGEAVNLPHPVDGFDRKQEELRELYTRLTEGVAKFFTGLAEWDDASHKVRGRLEALLRELPEQALAAYKAQYFKLAAKHHEFFVWANLLAHEETAARLKRNEEYFLLLRQILADADAKFDVGLKDVEKAVAALPARVLEHNARLVTETLRNDYRKAVEQPLLPDEDPGGPVYPRKCDIFVPQAFKTLRFEGAQRKRLEDESEWQRLEPRDDLFPFLLGLLDSAYSVDTPVLVLGHPGSGKSLLTQMLAGRFAVSAFNPIRVELRKFHAENKIKPELSQLLSERTGFKVMWGELTEGMKAAPPLVILDGFDELQQASGQSHAHFLEEVHEFQQEALQDGRPVRILVTSRVTLIDTARVPLGTTVIRLEDFDDARRERWISRWNVANLGRYPWNVRAFEIPPNDTVQELSHQPLLLLLLAVFDWKANELSRHKDLDQPLLYDHLLRRFIEREHRKDDKAFDADSPEGKPVIDADMHRLGVAALGMFNRGKVQIEEAVLDADQKAFDRPADEEKPPPRLLRSFYFVNESRARVYRGVEAAAVDGGGPAAYEFLHNTFGEFLAADFIVNEVLAHARPVAKLCADPDLKGALETTLREGLAAPWYYSLAYTPLYAKPVILRMLAEWARHKLDAACMDGAQLIAERQLKQLLAGHLPPADILTGKAPSPYPALPLLGHYAVYSLNLVLLLAALRDEGYVFKDASVPAVAGGAPAWDRLTHLWRTWGSLVELAQLAGVMRAAREDGGVRVRRVDGGPHATSRPAGIERVRLVSTALADDLLAGLSALHAYDAVPASRVDLADVRRRLWAADVDLDLEIGLRALDDAGWVAATTVAPSIRDRPLRARPSRSERHLLRWRAGPDVPASARASHAGSTRTRWNVPTLAFDVVGGLLGTGGIFRGALPWPVGWSEPATTVELIRSAAGLLSHADQRGLLARAAQPDAPFELGAALVDYDNVLNLEVRRRLLSQLLRTHPPDVLASARPEAARSLLEAAERNGQTAELVSWLGGDRAWEAAAEAQPVDVLLDIARIVGRTDSPGLEPGPLPWSRHEARARLQGADLKATALERVATSLRRAAEPLTLRDLERSEALRQLVGRLY